MKGLTVNVFQAKNFPNCSGGGISEFYDKLILLPNDVFPKIPPIFEPDEPQQCVVIKKKKAAGTDEDYFYAVKYEETEYDKQKRGPMFGGQFIHCSDSRFPCRYPVPLHDRYES